MRKIVKHIRKEWYRYIFDTIVVILGILIAFTLNNWNEKRLSKIASNEIYNNLLHTLRQDSTEIERIIKIQNKSLDALKKIITNNQNTIELEWNDVSSNNLIKNVMGGSLSFFPKYGVYNSIVSNNEMDLIYSNELKLSLVYLYDYQYKRYENIDAIVDQKFQFQIFSIIDKKMMFYSLDTLSEENNLIRKIDPILLKKHYSELAFEIKDSYRIMNTGLILLVEIQESINDLISILTKELKK